MVVSTTEQTAKVPPETGKSDKATQEQKEGSQDVQGHLMDSLEGMLEQAERARAAFLEAERQLATVYRQKDIEVAQEYSNTEEHAQIACDQAIEQAVRARDADIAKAVKAQCEALQQTADNLRQAREAADRICQEQISKAVTNRRAAISEAHQVRDKTIEQAWVVYSKTTK